MMITNQEDYSTQKAFAPRQYVAVEIKKGKPKRFCSCALSDMAMWFLKNSCLLEAQAVANFTESYDTKFKRLVEPDAVAEGDPYWGDGWYLRECD